MDAPGGPRLLLLDPAMEFGRPRLILAPIALSALLPSGVHAVQRYGAFRASTSTTSSSGGLLAPVTGAGNALCVTAAAYYSSTTGRRGVRSVRAAPTSCYHPADDDDDRSKPSGLDDDSAASKAAEIDDDANKPSGSGLDDDHSAASKATEIEDDANKSADPDVDAAVSKSAELFHANYSRSKRDIASWVELAQLQTTFEVAFDAGVLESGSDLRRLLDAIGEIDITAPARSWKTELLCLDRVCTVIGSDKLDELLSVSAPFEEDEQFGFSALAAQSMIEAIEHLMVTLHSLLHPVPNLLMSSSCPMILRQLLKVVYEFSTILESTKFKKPQNSIRYRMLEAHAVALEHVCAISLDIHEEACQEELKDKWAGLPQQLRNRRITLSEQDIGVLDYITSIGITDTERVYDLVMEVAMEVRVRGSSETSR